MLQIMLACTRTGQFVTTGIETDLDTFIALPEALSRSSAPHAATITIGQKATRGFAARGVRHRHFYLPK